MGWINEELNEAHEGWAGCLTDDGRISESSSGTGVYVAAPGTDEAGYPRRELVPWDRVAGWQAACTCGWRGDRWERAETIPGAHGGTDPEDAYLADGRTVEEVARESWQAHIEPLTTVAAVRRAHVAVLAAQAELERAVKAAAEAGSSWAEIGRAAGGITRQSARERWRHLTEQ
jgi:hypothetical protein